MIFVDFADHGEVGSVDIAAEGKVSRQINAFGRGSLCIAANMLGGAVHDARDQVHASRLRPAQKVTQVFRTGSVLSGLPGADESARNLGAVTRDPSGGGTDVQR